MRSSEPGTKRRSNWLRVLGPSVQGGTGVKPSRRKYHAILYWQRSHPDTDTIREAHDVCCANGLPAQRPLPAHTWLPSGYWSPTPRAGCNALATSDSCLEQRSVCVHVIMIPSCQDIDQSTYLFTHYVPTHPVTSARLLGIAP
ncbi:hypothetical protein FPOAC1_004864 [Fusarium poae]|uniref:hypothetical protein n=1 Tax=Fusarium poae TaxID=36050 RepID=UPI001CE9C325|nr:hypothetical protein FPOAC1_004864 [Fusarium poae]KAG8671613.1 hypothetical protein FPOAC1_004864 [Fusarium poae]